MVKWKRKWVKGVHFEVAGTTYEFKINKGIYIYIGQLNLANKM